MEKERTKIILPTSIIKERAILIIQALAKHGEEYLDKIK